jgi:hypothetical protein
LQPEGRIQASIVFSLPTCWGGWTKGSGILPPFGDGTYFGAEVNLSQASTAMLNVNVLVWPEAKTILDGFAYERFAVSARFWDNDAVEWLRKQKDVHSRVFHPQPWGQAAAVCQRWDMKLLLRD